MRMQRFFAIILVALAASVCVGCNTTPLTPTVTKPAQGLGEPIEVEEKVDDPFIVEVPGDDWNNTLPTVDTSVQYDYTDVSFGTAHGAFTEEAGTFTSAQADSILVCNNKNTPFPYGTIEFDIRTDTTSDSGVIFGLTSPLNLFWEGAGISYYFFFLNHEGLAYLGKCDNGGWWIHKQVSYTFNSTDTYRLKVVYEGSKICCYVNGVMVIGCRDRYGLSGTGWGFRTNKAGIAFSNVSLTSELCYGEGV